MHGWNMDTHERNLWNDIERFTLDVPDAALPFSRRLARENGKHGGVRKHRRFLAKWPAGATLAAAAVVATLVLPGCSDVAIHLGVPIFIYSLFFLLSLVCSPSRKRRDRAGSAFGSSGTGDGSNGSDGGDSGDGGDGGCGGGCGGD